MTGFAEAVAASPFAQWAGGSVYPFANVAHLFGLVMLVGAIGVVDLRLAGAFRAIPAAPLSRALTPIAIVGLLVMVPSGATLFAADATALAGSAVFRWKLVLILLALANAVTFRALWRRRIDDWDGGAPPVARAMAAASVLLWLGVAASGRMIAYS